LRSFHHNRAVFNGNPVSDREGQIRLAVQHAEILNICLGANPYRIDVGAHDDVRPVLEHSPTVTAPIT
jgi:hypothetical protein